MLHNRVQSTGNVNNRKARLDLKKCVIFFCVFIDDLTSDKSSRINRDVYRAIFSAQIQPNAVKLQGHQVILQMDNDQKHTVKATQSAKYPQEHKSMV